MKKQNKRKRDRVRPGDFRANNARTGHYSYITKIEKQVENTLAEFIGITSKPKTFNVKNIKLHKNPNPKTPNRPAYIHPKKDSVKLTSRTFGKRKKGWSFAKEDKTIINKIKKD